jgi:hypothetical protein
MPALNGYMAKILTCQAEPKQIQLALISAKPTLSMFFIRNPNPVS